MTRKYRLIEDDFCKEAVIFARVSSEKQEKALLLMLKKKVSMNIAKIKA